MNRLATAAAVMGVLMSVLGGGLLAASAQQAGDKPPSSGQLPMLFSTAPPTSGAQAQQKFELPSTFPTIPSGVAIIPQPDNQGQRAPAQPAASSPAASSPAAGPQAPTSPASPPPAAAPGASAGNPGGVAPAIPPAQPLAPLPTTTPLPPQDVATPIVPPTIPQASPLPATAAPQPAPAQSAPAPPVSVQAAPGRVAPAQATPAAGAAPAASVTPPPTPRVVVPPLRDLPPVQSSSTYPMFAGSADSRGQIIRLRDMGRSEGLHLEGTAAEASVSFTARQDDAFVGSRVSLMFSYSQAVARDEGELSVLLNNEPVGSVAIGKSKGPKSRTEFTFSPALLATDNRLQFRFALKGQGADACKIARDKAFWVNIEPNSFVYLSAARLPLADDLAFLPRPFVDPKDPLTLSLPFVMPASPAPEILQAAGMVAGYFGLIAQYKGATFPVVFDGLPATNAIVFVLADRYPPGVASIPGEGPRLAVITNPAQVDSKLLLVIGANAAELQTAAATLALGAQHLSGGWTAARDPLPPPRKPYDAPKWISTDHPVRLGDLVAPSSLNGRRIADSPQVSFRTAPDLFFGALSGGTLYLRLHRADDTWIDAGNSRLFVYLNQRIAGEVPLEPKLKVLSRLKEWLFPGRADDRVSQVILPGYQLFSSNRLDFVFELRASQSADCTSLEWSDRTGIDPDSLIDLTHVAHFAAFPNLALFANSGFPFSRLADLSDTAFVVSEAPSAEEVQAFLNILGKIADDTGIPATRYAIVDAAHVDTVADRNLIVVGLDSPDSLLRKWESYNSVHITSTSVSAVPQPSFFQRLFQPFDPRAPYYAGAAVELARMNLGKPYAYMSSYWSPLDANRIVVAIGGNNGQALVEMTKQWEDPDITSKIQGDFFYFTDGRGEFYTSNRRKFVGQLPIWWRIQWLAGSFGPAAFILIICAILIFAVTIQRFAAYHANKLLARRA
ncbi:MAG: cellulose biosynthesis cyclic di-GMP-binding regulatory protein BcsB [Alphaproteobacteria bacterium]|nr:cellulose biosynthesis cyclic di-GMP-binding regulatory protein BcsB [Alphaproteobacteria bacterium]